MLQYPPRDMVATERDEGKFGAKLARQLSKLIHERLGTKNGPRIYGRLVVFGTRELADGCGEHHPFVMDMT